MLATEGNWLIRLRAAFAIAFVVFTDIPIVQSTEVSPEIRAESESILREMLDQRSKLTSGIFRVKGEKYCNSDPSVPVVKGAVTAFVAFDYQQRLERFDSELPMFIRSIPSSAPESATAEIERPMVRWLRTPDLFADWSKTTKNNFQYLHVRKPGSKLQGEGLLAVRDVREAGLVHYMGLESSLGLEKTIERLLQLEPIEIRNESDGTKTVVLNVIENARFEIQVAPNRGMTATKILVVEPGVTFPGRDYVTTVDWQERNGVWVPIKCRNEFQIGDEYLDHRYYDLTLNWEAVNQPIDDSLFDYRKLDGIPDGTEIVDTRVDPQKVIGRYGPERVPDRIANPPVTKNNLRWLLVGNVVLLIVFLSYYWFKRRGQTVA